MESTAQRPVAVNAPVTDLDPYADAVLDDPYPHYERLRELGPIFYLSRYDAYGLARHAEIDAVLRDPATFCSSAGVGLANFHTTAAWRKPSIILEVDPPMHARTHQKRSHFYRVSELLVRSALAAKRRRARAFPDSSLLRNGFADNPGL